MSPGGLPAAATESEFGRFPLSRALWGAAFRLGRRPDSAACSWGFAFHPAQGTGYRWDGFGVLYPKFALVSISKVCVVRDVAQTRRAIGFVKSRVGKCIF